MNSDHFQGEVGEASKIQVGCLDEVAHLPDTTLETLLSSSLHIQALC